MTVLHLTTRVSSAQFPVILLLISLGVAGAVRAQPMGWSSQPAQYPSTQYVARSQAAPMEQDYMNPATPAYRGSNYTEGFNNAPEPVAERGDCENSPNYQPGCMPPVQQYQYGAPSMGWCDGSGAPNDQYGMGGYSCTPPVTWGCYAGALMLNRDDENHRFFSFDSADEAFQLLDSQNSNFNWGGGVEAHILRRDACSCTGFEVVYWGLFPDESFAFAFPSQVAGDLNGIFNFDQLDYNGVTADNFVNGAMVHRLRRNTEIHNVELNHIWYVSNCGGNNCGCMDSCASSCNAGCCGPRPSCSFQALVGLRYFRFEDNLEFASDPTNTVFTGAIDELYYNIDVNNDLVGVQCGGTGERAFGYSGLSFTFGAKAGVFANDADARSTIGGAAGLATINNGPNDGVAWDISSHKDAVATIAEVQAGIACAVSPTWRLRGDYRVIGISGVALPTNQIYQDLRGVQDVRLIATNGDLILHGVFVGVERTY